MASTETTTEAAQRQHNRFEQRRNVTRTRRNSRRPIVQTGLIRCVDLQPVLCFILGHYAVTLDNLTDSNGDLPIFELCKGFRVYYYIYIATFLHNIVLKLIESIIVKILRGN